MSVAQETEQEWIFTFGYDHSWQGEALGKRFVRVPGEYMAARMKVIGAFGKAWSSQYSAEKGQAVVDRHGLTELPFPGTVAARDRVLDPEPAVVALVNRMCTTFPWLDDHYSALDLTVIVGCALDTQEFAANAAAARAEPPEPLHTVSVEGIPFRMTTAERDDYYEDCAEDATWD